MKYLINFFFISAFYFTSIELEAQITMNKVDSLGLKQGMWREFKIPFDIVTDDVKIEIPNIDEEYYILTKEKHRKYFPIIECIGSYYDNLKTGIWSEYHPNGKIRSQINYKRGIPFGQCLIFWDNGVLKMKCDIGFDADFPIRIYSEEGKLLEEKTVSKSNVIKAIYEN